MKCFLAGHPDLVQFIRYVKLVIAVAIIRSRPPGLTSEQYARHLCAHYQQQQTRWKQEAEKLRKQLAIMLRQKSALGWFQLSFIGLATK